MYDLAVRPTTTGKGELAMTFGQRVRELRRLKGLTLRELAPQVGVGFTYLSRIENEKLNYGDYPSEALIHRLAEALEADEEELTVLAERVPERIRKRVLQRPDVFGVLANCDDTTLDKVLRTVGAKRSKKRG